MIAPATAALTFLAEQTSWIHLLGDHRMFSKLIDPLTDPTETVDTLLTALITTFDGNGLTQSTEETGAPTPSTDLIILAN